MDFRNDFSYKGELFETLELPWKMRIRDRPLAKIRLAGWKPKQDRNMQAVYYYDCRNKKEVEDAKKDLETKPLKEVAELYNKMYEAFITDNPVPNTGEANDFKDKFILEARKL